MVELMLVVAIIGIIASVALPRVSDASRRNRAREELQRVGGVFVEARGKAHSNLRCVDSTIDTAAKTISYVVYACGTTPTTTPTKSFSFPTLVLSEFDDTISTSTKFPTITFNPAGGLTSGAKARMVATTEFNDLRHFRIFPAIGQVDSSVR